MKKSAVKTNENKPWYREPWPWLLMSGPAIVVVAGIATAVIAVRTHDGLVVDDYYKQGLAVNKDLSRDTAAKVAGYRANATIELAKGRIVLSAQHLPAEVTDLMLTLSRAAVSGNDRRIVLQRSGESTFVGTLSALDTGKWYVRLDDQSHAWRLMTSITVRSDQAINFSLGIAPAAQTGVPADG